MTSTKLFSLICWLIWMALLVAASSRAIPWALAMVLGGSIYALWHLYRRAVIART